MTIWKYYLPRIIFDNPFLYHLYFQLIRKHRGIVPDYFTSETDYYFDGYPRSGNTYLAQLVLNIFGDKKAVHHLHRTAPVKIALKKGLPSFILIRNPEDAISSYYLKFFAERKRKIPERVNKKLLSHMSKDYLKYYQYVLSKKNKIHLIQFDDLINKPEEIVYDINKKLGYNYEFDEIKKLVVKFDKSYVGATSRYGSSKPSEVKEIEKDKVKKVMTTLRYPEKCRYVYEKLQTKR